MHTIYLIENIHDEQTDLVTGIALCDDGTMLTFHISSNVDILKDDLGLTLQRKHDRYINHCGEGNYKLVWVGLEDNPDAVHGLNEAIAKLSPTQPPTINADDE